MNKAIKGLVGLNAVLWSGAAMAQVAGSAQPVPGSGDSSRMTRESRDVNESYNKAAAELTARNSKTRKPKAVPATAADVVAGKDIRDSKGLALGKVEKVESDGIVVAAPAGMVRVPIEAFGKDPNGLLLSITKAEFDAAVAAANGPPAQ